MKTQLYRDLNENLQLNLANYERNYGKKFKASILDDLYDYQEFLAKKLKDRDISESEKQNLISIYTPIIEELEILVEEQYGRIVGGNKKIINKLKKYK